MEVDAAKAFAGVGSILAALGPLGYGALAMVGIMLIFIGLLFIADYYKDGAMSKDAVMWFP